MEEFQVDLALVASPSLSMDMLPMQGADDVDVQLWSQISSLASKPDAVEQDGGEVFSLDVIEPEIVQPGVDEPPRENNGDEIVVTGYYLQPDGPGVWMRYVDESWGNNMFPTLYPDGGGGDQPTDESRIDIIFDDDFNRPLTESEQKAVDALKQSIADIKAAIATIPDNGRITLPNGEIVTGRDLKEQWSKVDFEISEGKISTANVNVNTMNPLIRIDLGHLVRADNAVGDINYTVLHELGHTISESKNLFELSVAAGTSYSEIEARHQRLANDFAKFLADFAGIPVRPNVGYGYTEVGTYWIGCAVTSSYNAFFGRT